MNERVFFLGIALFLEACAFLLSTAAIFLTVKKIHVGGFATGLVSLAFMCFSLGPWQMAVDCFVLGFWVCENPPFALLAAFIFVAGLGSVLSNLKYLLKSRSQTIA